MAKKAAAKTKTGKRRVPRKRAAQSAGLEPLDCRLESSADIEPVVRRVEKEGGLVLSSYRDPLGGLPLLFAILPIDRVQPTPFQRDLSEAHHKRLAGVIDKTGRFLDPVIAVPAPDSGFWTPNGYHRLEAMRRLGAKSITALLIPDREVARQILALNTEKAHNLKEKSLEVIRIYKGLLEEDPAKPESGFAFYLEEAALVTLGMAYEEKRGFGGGAYHPILRRLETFSDEPLREAVKPHRQRAKLVLELDEKVAEAVTRLKERGLQSPYLRALVVSRINPLRWIKGDLPDPEKILQTMRDRAGRFNAEKIEQKDLAGAAGGPPDED
jgi:ParB family chromosome partitioning protein